MKEMAKTYNDFPYDSLAIKQSHPLHLYQIARLCGLEATPAVNAQVLELGCASGGNIIPMAYHLPQATFLGIDLAENQIEQGIAVIKDLRITNIQLKPESILDFQSNDTFDYIICHGLFSWVPTEVRNHVFALCQQYLAKNGVAYISYNTLPGWQMGNIVRNQLQAKTQDLEDPALKVHYARRLLRELRFDMQSDPNAYSQLLQNEIALINEHSDNQLLHEHLSPYNYPLYIKDFVAQASRYQLKYLSDAFLSNDDVHFTQENELIEALQTQDILKNRRFRCTLLCHQSAENIKKPVAQDNFQMSFPIFQIGQVPDKPILCPLARYQASKGEIVTNHRHENITLTPVAQTLSPFLDGTRDNSALTEILIAEIVGGDLILVDKQGHEITQKETRFVHAAQIVEDTIRLLAKNALLDGHGKY
jgi:SAM-dependent methyltransferase